MKRPRRTLAQELEQDRAIARGAGQVFDGLAARYPHVAEFLVAARMARDGVERLATPTASEE